MHQRNIIWRRRVGESWRHIGASYGEEKLVSASS
jgi:hypothetical protein